MANIVKPLSRRAPYHWIAIPIFASDDQTKCTGEVRIEARLNSEIEFTLTITDSEGRLIERQILTFDQSLGSVQNGHGLTWTKIAAMTGEELCKIIGLETNSHTVPGARRQRARRFEVAGRDWWAILRGSRLRLECPHVTHEGLLEMTVSEFWQPKE